MDLSILIADDLAFLLPLLRKFPKCYWIWNYRLWLLEQTIGYLSTIQAQKFWQQELVLAGKMLSLDSRNFNGWGYRRKVIEALRSFEPSEDNSQIVITEQEFEYTTKMITSNLSNFSAWHYRSKLIPTLLDERRADHKTRCEFLDEGKTCNRLIGILVLMGDKNWNSFKEHFGRAPMTNPCGSTTNV